MNPNRGWWEWKADRPRHILSLWDSTMCQWNRCRPTWVWLVILFPALWQSQSEAALSWPQTEEILLVVTFTIQAASSASMLLYSLYPMFPHTFIPLYLSATQNPSLISTTWNFIMYFLVPSNLSSTETCVWSKTNKQTNKIVAEIGQKLRKCLKCLTKILESIQSI